MTEKTIKVKPVITISVDTMVVLVSDIEKMKLWADPGQIQYIRKFKEPKDLFKISVEKSIEKNG